MTETRPSCGGGKPCDYYKPSPVDDEVARRAAAAGVALPGGLCWRYPTPVPRKEGDCCGEHQAVRRHWIGILAREIVAGLKVVDDGKGAA